MILATNMNSYMTIKRQMKTKAIKVKMQYLTFINITLNLLRVFLYDAIEFFKKIRLDNVLL